MLNKRLVRILSDGKFHSGSEIGKQLEVSRAAVWKQIKKLGDFGLTVHAVPGKGYQIPGGVDLLDRAKITQALGASSHDVAPCLDLVDVVDSTNLYVMDKIVKAIPDRRAPFVCISESQVAGRARYGRVWGSTFGSNVYLSMGAKIQQGVGSLEKVNAAASIAVLESLMLGSDYCSVRWPNEIFAKDKKLGEVVSELKGDVAGVCHLVVGVSLNLRTPAMMARSKETENLAYLQELVQTGLDRNKVISGIIAILLGLYEALEADGLNSYLSRWPQYDALSEKAVQLVIDGQRVQGRVKGIDHSGRLKLETKEGLESFSGAEIEYID